MFITAESLLNYQRCNRRAFLDYRGDIEQRDPPNDYLTKLRQDSAANRQQVLTDRQYAQPHYPRRDWLQGAAETRKLMARGVEQIYQGVLLNEVEGATLVSVPDLLVKQPGQSVFGDWLYVPTEIKLSKRPKQEYQILAAFHVKVLAAVQDAWCETVFLLLKDRGLYEVDLWEVLPRMEAILEGCLATLQAEQAPEVFIARSRCGLCHWFSHCYQIAKTSHHLSLLPGVTQSRYLQLQALNLTSLEALVDIPSTQLEPLPGFGGEASQKLLCQARSTLYNQAILSDHPSQYSLQNSSNRTPPRSLSHPPNSPPRRVNGLVPPLPIAPIELYFDIEAEPSLNLIYLHGILVVDRLKQTEVFHPLLAERPEDEPVIWQQFLDLVWAYPTAPIFHFCPYEWQTVEKLGQLYHTPTALIAPLQQRFVDLHDWVTQAITLPVESYALKHIARWMGFHWRDATANGAQSIFWYAQWLATNDRAYLDAIVTYNEDDCRATHHVKDWLVNFLQQAINQAEGVA